jgi:N-acetylated-alpha-linked acidic dipeptidase
MEGERDVVESIRLDDAWTLVEEFAGLVRDSGSQDELRAVERITTRLDTWRIPHQVHRPELLISLPRRAGLTVDDRAYAAKTPSMARSTRAGGETAAVVYQPSEFAHSVHDIFAGAATSGNVAGRFVLTEGLPMPGKVADLEARGAAGVICISPGERIHEGICTTVWGSPDLTTFERRPRIPVVSVSNSDGADIIRRVQTGAAAATMVAEHEEGWRPIPVTVAEIRGAVEPERFVLVHGHIDSWHAGIGDNATGDATLLELARVLGQHRHLLARSVRIAWWSGHSHGRYAGSSWYAETFANDLLRNCICHVNCDSPGCRDATVYEDVYWMAEVEDFARQAVRDFTGLAAEGRQPLRAGDISFNNLGISTFFMLSSTMPAGVREARGSYPVGGCGGNIEWHTEADTIEVADRENLLRDMRLYAGAVFRAAQLPVHPLDFRPTLDQLSQALARYRQQLHPLVDLGPVMMLAAQVRESLGPFYAAAAEIESVVGARRYNDALLRIGRKLVSILYTRAGRFRQDPALDQPLLPDLAAAASAAAGVPEGVARAEVRRALNRIEEALLETAELIGRCVPAAPSA